MVSQSAFWLRPVAYLIAMAHEDSFPIDAAIEAQVLGLAQTAPSAETQLALPADERVVRRSYWTDRGFSDDLAIGSRTAWRKHYPFEYQIDETTVGLFFCRGMKDPRYVQENEFMCLFFENGYWQAGATADGRTLRQVLFRTDVQNIWRTEAVPWEINEAASRDGNHHEQPQWSTYPMLCVTKWEGTY